MIRLYCPELRAGEVELPPEEGHHAAHVLRAKVGESVTLFDGQGREADGSIAVIGKRRVVAQVGEIRTREFDGAYRVTIAIALGKAHRQSYVVEKCTELGVAAIWPMITERSVTRPGEAAVEKWSRRAIEAAKQSGRAYVPAIASVQPFAEVLARGSEFDAAAIADVPSEQITTSPNRQITTSEPLLPLLRAKSPGSRVLCLIGPEGGWSDAERQAALTAGLNFVTLSRTILRTETAAVTACAAAALLSPGVRYC